MQYRDSGNNMIRTAMRAPYLERGEEHKLARRWKENQDQQALHEITVAHMRLVISMASNSAIRPAARRFNSGRPCRLAGSRGPFRSRARSPFLDICHLVGPGLYAGLCIAQLVNRPRRHFFGAEIAVFQSQAPTRENRQNRQYIGGPATCMPKSQRHSVCRKRMLR